jgi:hypothetical protein
MSLRAYFFLKCFQQGALRIAAVCIERRGRQEDRVSSLREKKLARSECARVFAHSKERRLYGRKCVSASTLNSSHYKGSRGKNNRPHTRKKRVCGGSNRMSSATPPFTVIYYYALQLHCLINILTGNECPGASLILQIFLPLLLLRSVCLSIYICISRGCVPLFEQKRNIPASIYSGELKRGWFASKSFICLEYSL